MRADARRNRARVLAAAEAVFQEAGAAATTEQIARRAGVGIGTVFRHFPTKSDLLHAIITDSLERLTVRVTELESHGDPATAFYDFFTELVRQAGEKHGVMALLAQTGEAPAVHKPIDAWRATVERLLARAQAAGAVRPDVGGDDVLALLLGLCQTAVTTGWDDTRCRAVLRVVFDGLAARH
ncbi:TetR family transcriptional regulator [Stackebrandtia albiflava]|uniref:TetR family transcriptional regulator n=1 Tax=Stackebrandtia albiflava TaxID=406432 RepID=A0A562V0Y2_9ACTN|nr:TetR/AcrR family transcriptional regulator [Stackebrandtia albiflava]TWJ11541.1 TetR family transcriptional regulator [Stackebrandtia albiflava]